MERHFLFWPHVSIRCNLSCCGKWLKDVHFLFPNLHRNGSPTPPHRTCILAEEGRGFPLLRMYTNLPWTLWAKCCWGLLCWFKSDVIVTWQVETLHGRLECSCLHTPRRVILHFCLMRSNDHLYRLHWNSLFKSFSSILCGIDVATFWDGFRSLKLSSLPVLWLHRHHSPRVVRPNFDILHHLIGSTYHGFFMPASQLAQTILPFQNW